jgi:hypothetical protein
MSLRDLFVAKPSRTSGDTPVFVTPQSIVTFPIASLAVNVIWRVLAVLVPSAAGSQLVAVIIAFVIGLFIYAISVDWTASLRERLIALGIALINCFFLAASALGISVVGAPAPK